MRKLLPFCGVLLVFAFGFSGCSGGNNSTSSSMQASGVVVHISDPTTCSAAQGGSFSAVYVTISDVKIHQSSTAGPNDPGWVDLTPNLKTAPVQVNLLGIPDNQCFLATLGDKTEIQPGTFQQIRLILADNSQASKIAGGTNNCAPLAVTNCAVPAGGGPIALLLPSELQTGIKIPAGQIAGGQFTVPAGQTVDLDIDFNACASIVMQGNGVARLKPVLHAGEIELQTKTSINGTITDSSGTPIAGAMVMLAQPGAACSGAGCVSNAAIEDVKMATTTDSSGTFIFCPVSAGTYDVIAIAVNGGTAFAATVTSGVQPGNALGKVKLISAGAQATIKGTVTTTTAANAPIAEVVTVVPMQAVTINSTIVLIPIPQFGGTSTTTTITTAVPNPPSHTCTPTTVACNDYTVMVPAGNPSVGVFNPTGTTYTQAAPPVNFIVDGTASSCSPAEEQTNQQANPPGGSLTVTTGGTVTASTLAFTGCQ
jgi:hypothetical protein